MKGKKILKKIAKVLFSFVIPILLLIFAGADIFLFISQRVGSVGGNQMPMPFGYGIGVVLSGSMEPTYSVDDVIIVKDTDNYQVNDVVVFQEGKSLTVHRVIEVQKMTKNQYRELCEERSVGNLAIENKGEIARNDGNKIVAVYTTKGDNNNAPDRRPILNSDICGEVVYVAHGARKVVDFLQSPFIIIVAGVLAFFMMQFSFKKQKADDDAELEALKAEIEKMSHDSTENKTEGTEIEIEQPGQDDCSSTQETGKSFYEESSSAQETKSSTQWENTNKENNDC